MKIHPTARAAENATIVGDVTLAENASIWYGAVLRGDAGPIYIGKSSNIQDNCVLHDGAHVKDNVVVGHGAILHGCVVEDGCLIGMGSILLDGAVIGEGAVVGAGSLVTGGTFIPPGTLALGSPARVVRPLREEEREKTLGSAAKYVRRAQHQLPLCNEP